MVDKGGRALFIADGIIRRFEQIIDRQYVIEKMQKFYDKSLKAKNDGSVSDTYGPISSIPTTFIIDRKGNIVEKIIGSRRKAEFENKIKPLL